MRAFKQLTHKGKIYEQVVGIEANVAFNKKTSRHIMQLGKTHKRQISTRYCD